MFRGRFLVSFVVDARGGVLNGSRHSGIRLIIPQGRATMPTRVVCKLIKKEKLTHPPPLNEGEALATRILQMGNAGIKFSGYLIKFGICHVIIWLFFCKHSILKTFIAKKQLKILCCYCSL